MIGRITALLATLSLGAAEAQSLTAAKVIRANAIIEATDYTVSATSIAGALTSDTEIVGLEARVTLYPGRPIMPNHVGPAALVVRNQQVTLVYRSGGLSITAEARSLARGGIGDSVRVMNLGSRSVVTGRVRPDGAVEVQSERLEN